MLMFVVNFIHGEAEAGRTKASSNVGGFLSTFTPNNKNAHRE